MGNTIDSNLVKITPSPERRAADSTLAEYMVKNGVGTLIQKFYNKNSEMPALIQGTNGIFHYYKDGHLLINGTEAWVNINNKGEVTRVEKQNYDPPIKLKNKAILKFK